MSRETNNIQLVAKGAVVLGGAYALKAFYSVASVNELTWVLAPTTTLVEAIANERFTFESYAGYVNDERSFVIASSCSGINFLLAAFLLLTAGRYVATRELTWTRIAAAAAAAYLSTLIANTVRICIALRLRRIDPELVWLNPDQLHRFEGIAVYFGFLLLLFLGDALTSPGRISSFRPSPLTYRLLLLPLLTYYAVTLGMPVINAYRSGTALSAGFREHLSFVLIVPLALVGAVMLIKCVKQNLKGPERSNLGI